VTDEQHEPDRPRPRPRFFYTENWQRFVPKVAATTPPPRVRFVPPHDPPPAGEK
jgi:hypothetical protein